MTANEIRSDADSVLQSAREAREREVRLAKEIAELAQHRRQELADERQRKRFDQ